MTENDRILVAVLDRTVYVRPFGYATQKDCLGLPDFLKAMFREGCVNVAFDLGETVGMDSTFLGVIASAAMPGPRTGEKSVVVLNADEHARRELRTIGLVGVIALRDEPYEPPADVELSEVDFVHLPGTERERLIRIKELHEGLVKLNDKNKRNFGAFVKMLDEELERN